MEGPVQAILTNLETAVTTEHEFAARISKDGWQEHWVPSLPPGAYRIRVATDDNAEPIEDFFVVLD